MINICIIATIVIYLVGMLLVGFVYSKSNEDSSDFYLGGRTMGPLVTAMSAEASDMSSWLLMGMPGLAYLTGIASPGWTAIGLAVGTWLNWLIVARRLRREEITAASPLGLCHFSTFDVNRYPDTLVPEFGVTARAYMTKLLELSKNYAAKFNSKSKNLLFMGRSGLGKTHLAQAIADAVLEGGHDVLYTSAAALAAQLGREHFNYTTNDEWLAACQEADLLILDDLGTEYITPLTISVLYELIYTRMLTERPTIYTTNITDQSVFAARYTEKVASRILGSCQIFKFFGTDQRLKRGGKR